MTKMATTRQTYALFCITKRDYRNDNLTYDEASKLIATLGDPNYKQKTKDVVSKDTKFNDAARIMEEAVQAGRDAMTACTPTPMVVEQHIDVLNDKSAVTDRYFVSGGVCGFAWVKFKANTTPNRKFLAGLKKAGMVGEHCDWSKHYQGGYSYWISEGGQSMEKKEAFARAFADVLHTNGIECYVGSRMD